MIIDLDIETIPHPEAILSPSWGRKKAKDLKKGIETGDEQASLVPAFMQVICICALTYQDGKWISFSKISEDEKQLLIDFEEWRKSLSHGDIFCGHFGKGFDFPSLAVAYLRHGLELPNPLRVAGKKPWEIRHIDTAELCKFGGFAPMSLDALCYVLGIPTPKDAIDGSEVWQAWKDGRQNEILKYCQKDTKALNLCRRKLEKLKAI